MKHRHPFHVLSKFLAPAFYACHADGDGGGGAGGATGATGGGAGDGASAAAGAAAGGGAAGAGAATGKGGAGAGANSGTPSPTNLSAHIAEDGSFKKGWAAALGVPPAWETKFSRPDALLKSHANLESMLGKGGKVSIPGPTSTPEEKAAFNRAMGIPEKADGYQIKMPEKIGDKPFPKELWNDDEAKKFSEFALAQSLTPAQAAALAEYDAARNFNYAEQARENHEKSVAAARAELKKEWGIAHDEQLKIAEAGARAVGFDPATNPEMANSPAFIKAMAKVGRMIGETPAAGARGSATPVDAKARIAEIRGDKSSAYNNKSHPGHAAAVLEVQNLYRAIHGDEPVKQQ
jgi:hypothetical protein